MKELVKIDCYIEEYKNQSNCLSARLRDKKTNKKIILSGKNVNKEHLLKFLSQAKINQDIMPTIYERNGTDKIAVRGYIVSVKEKSIEVCIDVESGGYLFE